MTLKCVIEVDLEYPHHAGKEKLTNTGFGGSHWMAFEAWKRRAGRMCGRAYFQPEAQVKDVSSGMSVPAGRIDEKRGGELFAGSL